MSNNHHILGTVVPKKNSSIKHFTCSLVNTRKDGVWNTLRPIIPHRSKLFPKCFILLGHPSQQEETCHEDDYAKVHHDEHPPHHCVPQPRLHNPRPSTQLPGEPSNSYQHPTCVTGMTNDSVRTRYNKLVVLLNTGLKSEKSSQVAEGHQPYPCSQHY